MSGMKRNDAPIFYLDVQEFGREDRDRDQCNRHQPIKWRDTHESPLQESRCGAGASEGVGTRVDHDEAGNDKENVDAETPVEIRQVYREPSGPLRDIAGIVQRVADHHERGR
jgi:hypothetical protein